MERDAEFNQSQRGDSVNLNTLARDITKQEGGKVNLSIAQVKEVLRLTFEKLAEMHPVDALTIVRRYESQPTTKRTHQRRS